MEMQMSADQSFELEGFDGNCLDLVAALARLEGLLDTLKGISVAEDELPLLWGEFDVDDVAFHGCTLP
jgi:hypothetical protein